MFRILTAFTLIATLAAPAAARELTADEKAALAERVDAFKTSVASGDFGSTLKATPPRIYAFIAEQAGVTADEVVAQAEVQIREAMGAVSLDDFKVEMASARYLETSDGTPYALIPTETTMTMPDLGSVRTTSETLALLDSGAWYLMRVERQQQLLILREVYPAFADVEIPVGTTEVLP